MEMISLPITREQVEHWNEILPQVNLRRVDLHHVDLTTESETLPWTTIIRDDLYRHQAIQEGVLFSSAPGYAEGVDLSISIQPGLPRTRRKQAWFEAPSILRAALIPHDMNVTRALCFSEVHLLLRSNTWGMRCTIDHEWMTGMGSMHSRLVIPREFIDMMMSREELSSLIESRLHQGVSYLQERIEEVRDRIPHEQQ